MKKKIILLSLILTSFFLLTIYWSAGPNPLVASSHTAGFWLGIWHGFTCLITFVIQLLSSDIQIYEVHNSGSWYDAGFIFGGTILSKALRELFRYV